jgi:O-antigen/teichoic acid export membrane protein
MSVERYVSHTLVLRVANTALLILQSIFVTRLLGPEGRGLMAKLQASQNFFILFLGLGVAAALSHYLPSRVYPQKKVLGTAFLVWLGSILALLGFQILFLCFPKTDLIFPHGFALTFFETYFIVSFALNFLQTLMNAALSGRHRFSLTNWLELIAAILRVAIFGACFVYHLSGVGEIRLETIFLWDMALTILRAVMFTLGYIDEFGLALDLKIREVFRPVVKFSLMVYVSSLINFLYLRLDFWLTERQLGLAALGVYATASGLAQFLTFVPMTLNTIMLPLLSGIEPKMAMHKLRFFSSFSATAVSLMALSLILFASPLIHLLYGDSFGGAVLPLRIVTVSFLFLSLKHLFVYYNVSQNRARKNIEAEMGGLVLGVIFNLLLMPRLGTVGASLASLIANGFSLLYLVVGIFHRSDMPWHQFFFMRPSEARGLLGSLFQAEPAT